MAYIDDLKDMLGSSFELSTAPGYDGDDAYVFVRVRRPDGTTSHSFASSRYDLAVYFESERIRKFAEQ